jgi:hypothetical protein
MDSSRIASFSQGFALLLLAASAGCSSTSGSDAGASTGSSSGSGSSGSGSSGSGGSGSGGATPVVDGGGASCPPQTDVTAAVQVNVSVTWPEAVSINGGSGPYVLWLLSTYTVGSDNKVTSSTRTCQVTAPAIDLTTTGDIASGVPTGMMGKVGYTVPVVEWNKVMRASTSTGELGGWNVGSSIYIAASVALIGLSDSSPYKDPTKTWPNGNAKGYPFGGPPAPSFLVAEEGDPSTIGVAAVPLTTAGYAKIRTALGGGGPAVDKMWSASRTEFSLYGTSSSCKEASGTANVKLIDSHVVGCEIEDGGGPCTDPAQWGYIDSNRTVYKPGASTFKQVYLTTGATCDDVIAALPPP